MCECLWVLPPAPLPIGCFWCYQPRPEKRMSGRDQVVHVARERRGVILGAALSAAVMPDTGSCTQSAMRRRLLPAVGSGWPCANPPYQ
jgi:hypothetical protein